MHSMLKFFLAESTIPSWVWFVLPIIAVVFAGVGVAAGICIYRRYRNRKIGSTQAQADSILNFAREEAKALKNEAIKEAREENQRQKIEAERQFKERSGELAKQESRMSQKEEALDKKEEMLLKKLDQIDVQQKQLITRLKYPERYIAVLNDPVPRRYPTRRELVTLAAQMRRNPYDYTITESMRRLQQRTGYYTDEDTCNLTECEERALYEAGVRHYAIQAQMIRNEITLWWDMFYHMLRAAPEHTNKAALVMSAAMASIRENPDRVPGGLGLFSLTNELD